MEVGEEDEKEGEEGGEEEKEEGEKVGEEEKKFRNPLTLDEILGDRNGKTTLEEEEEEEEAKLSKSLSCR